MTEKYPLRVERILPEHVGMEIKGTGSFGDFILLTAVGKESFLFWEDGREHKGAGVNGPWLVRPVEKAQASGMGCPTCPRVIPGGNVLLDPKPKKKVLLAQVLIKGSDGGIGVSTTLYPSKEFAKKDWVHHEVLEWPVGVQIEREVEE